MSGNAYFLWTLLVTRSYIAYGLTSVRTPASWAYTWLHNVGYQLDHSQSLTFEVRVKQDAILNLGTMDQSVNGGVNAFYRVIIGGWFNTKSSIRNLFIHDESHYYDGKVLDEDEFKGFKVSWSEGKIKIYRREMFCLKKVADMLPSNGTNQINAVGITTRNFPGYWRFLEVAKHDHGRRFQTMPSLIDKNFTSSIILTKHSANVGMCSLFCHSNNGCFAFTYNNIHNQCQLHSERYCSASGQELKTERGSTHYSSFDDNY